LCAGIFAAGRQLLACVWLGVSGVVVDEARFGEQLDGQLDDAFAYAYADAYADDE